MNEIGFKSLELRRVYDSADSSVNLIRDFYVPVLSRAFTYDRLTFSFSSAALRAAALGVAGFIENSGRMRLIAAPRLSSEDKRSLLESSDDDLRFARFETILLGKVRGLIELANEIERSYVDALGWMMREGTLDLRLAVPESLQNDDDGGIFHTKLGVLRDTAGDSISFSGSINETQGAWKKNIERFKVYRSWVDTDKEDFTFDEETFQGYWYHPEKFGIQFVPISEAIEEEFSRNSRSGSNLLRLKEIESANATELSSGARPRDYQVAAIRDWLANGKRGILSMATGSGKTFTASLAVEELLNTTKRLAVFVLVPNSSIGAQWSSELSRLAVELLSLSEYSNWSLKLEQRVNDLALGAVNSLIVISVMNRAGSEKFLRQIATLRKHGISSLLIADEAHRFGAPKVRNALTDDYEYRLGLSATPKRYFDEEGTDYLLEYFSGSVFEFSIEDALDWIPPIGQNPILCPFSYTPVFVELSDDEREKYLALTRSIISKRQNAAGDSEKTAQEVFELMLARARVKKTASKKVEALREQLSEREAIRHTLIYCENSTQMERVFEVLEDFDLIAAPFTENQGTKPERRFGERSEREEILRRFRQGDIHVLVSMTLLDEGVDIPEARRGFILASSGNAKEFVQRTGRLIRFHESKETAEIVDFLVTPDPLILRGEDHGVTKAELNLLEAELVRMEEYTAPASNSLSIMSILSNMRDRIRVLSGGESE